MTLVKTRNKTFPSFFDDFFTREYANPSLNNNRHYGYSTPKVNILENENEYKLEVAAPGLKKADFNIEVNKNVLKISSLKEDEKVADGDHYNKKEFHYYSFERSFTLPERTVNSEEIKAKYSEGILTVSIPKKEEAKPKPSRAIKIN